MKICYQCKLEKELTEFSRNKTTKDGFQYQCKSCRNDYNRNYKATLSPELREKYKNYHKSYLREWSRRLTPQARIKYNLRNRLWYAIKGKGKSISAIRDLGCSIEFLKEYIASKFQTGMSWDNYGEWHIDHIYPLAKVDFSNTAQVKKAIHYTNLQPLWAVDNIKKSDKLVNY